MLLAIMVIVLVPIIFYPNFYTNILVDGILGIAFAYVLYSAYREEDNSQFQFLEIFCGMTILLLTKTQGIGLAILAMIIILFQLWLERKKQKQTVRKKVKLLFFSVICAVMLLSIWNIKIRKEQHRWDFTRMYQEQSVETTKKVTKEFIHAIFKGKFITERKVTACYHRYFCTYASSLQANRGEAQKVPLLYPFGGNWYTCVFNWYVMDVLYYF